MARRATLLLLVVALTIACSDSESARNDAEERGATRAGVSVDAGHAGEPTKLGDVPGMDLVTLHLYVSNQSSHPALVDIRVELEGVPVVAGDFSVEGQHNWVEFDIRVPRGTLALRATALSGDVVLTEAVEIPGERWAVLDYWYYPDEQDEPGLLWTLRDEPVSFE